MRKLKLEELGRITVEEYHTIPKMPVVVVLDNIRAILLLKSEGYTIAGIEQTDHSIKLGSVVPDVGKIAVIFGNEVDGISDEILHELNLCIEIPQYGTKHSLNVSVCAGIVLWELTKMRL